MATRDPLDIEKKVAAATATGAAAAAILALVDPSFSTLIDYGIILVSAFLGGYTKKS